MTSFETVYKAALNRLGSRKTLESKLPVPLTNRQLIQHQDSEYLSLMSRRIFRAGLKHSMVDAKWSEFEKVFHDFDIQQVRMMSDEYLEKLMHNKGIIRHWGKIKAVRNNAQSMYELLDEYKSMGQYLANWPVNQIIGLWQDLQSRFTQLGGNSAAYFLRMSGKDTFLLTRYVQQALISWNAVKSISKSKKSHQEVQTAMNQWHEESNRPLCQISMILALSVD